MTTTPPFPLNDYDKIIVAFSGGKDSLVAALTLFELGLSPDRIEFWHHLVDGHATDPIQPTIRMDWPCTTSYCKAVARAFDVPLYMSWRTGGFAREMLRENQHTAPIRFETPEGIRQVGGTAGAYGTRRKFPQVTANLQQRWCSAYLKIHVACAALRNQERFNNTRTLFITGERAEESPSRARYSEFEPHAADTRNGRAKRHIDHWRPVLSWTSERVWECIKHWKVNPHPCYWLGWGRCSCAACIFGSHHQWASLAHINAPLVASIGEYEDVFGVTIHRSLSVRQRVERGTPYPMSEEAIKIALSADYTQPIILSDATWVLPAGASGESCGPA